MNNPGPASHQTSPSNSDVFSPVGFLLFVSHRISRKYALYLFVATLGLIYGYSTIVKPAFYIISYVVWWLLLIPTWIFYIIRWIFWRVVWGIQALAWFGFYVHFGGYGVKFILECIDKVWVWFEGVMEEMKNQDRKR